MRRPRLSKIDLLGPVALRLLVLLLALDLVFLVLHAGHVRYDVPGSGMWLISRDRGFPELFQYLKELAMVAVLLRLAVASRRPLYLLWSGVFAYLLIDDSLEVHETVGESLGDALGTGTRFGIEQRDLGQILVSGAVGIAILAALALALRRDRSPARSLSFRLVALLAALAFFGVVTDTIDAIDLFGVVEDGGEMVTISAMLAVVVDHHRRFGPGQTEHGPEKKSRNLYQPVE